jgi:hypothetical protein
MRRSPRGALAALALLLAACTSTGGTPSASEPPPGSTPPSSGPTGGGIEHPAGDEAILVVSSQGGLIPIEWTARALPNFVLLGDGRVIVGGAVPAIFPGPAVMPLNERTLTEEGIQTILEAVEETGLFTSDLELRGAQGMVADAADTVFELHAAGNDVTVTVYGLGLVDPEMELPPGMTSAELEAHRLLTGLNDALLTIDTSVPAEQWEAEGWQPYEPQAFRLYVRDVSGEPVDAEVPPDVRDWPGTADPATFGEEVAHFGNGTRCGTVDGEEAAAWLADLSTATEISQWTTDGEDRYTIIARPLLPYEEVACPEAPQG